MIHKIVYNAIFERRKKNNNKSQQTEELSVLNTIFFRLGQLASFILKRSINLYYLVKQNVKDIINCRSYFVPLNLDMAASFAQNNQNTDAIFRFKLVLFAQKNNLDALIGLACVYIKLKKYKQAQKYLLKIDPLHANSPEVSHLLSVVLSALKPQT